MGANIYLNAGSKKDLCTAYFQLGWLSAYLHDADRQHGRYLFADDPSIWHGYVRWAQPVADYVSADGPLNVVARYSMWPFVKAWALEMAHRTEPEKLPCNLLGAAICTLGLPVLRLIVIQATASDAQH